MFLFLWSSIANTIGNGLQMVKMVIMMMIMLVIEAFSHTLEQESVVAGSAKGSKW